jgi:phosphomannomutase
VGPALDALENYLPIKMIKIFHEPDSNFPNGGPNPLLPENRHPLLMR